MTAHARRIGIDIDGVTVDLVESVNRFLAHRHQLRPLEAWKYDWIDDHGIPGEALWAGFWQEGMDHLATASPIDGAIPALHRLAALHDVRFITYRPDAARDATRRWLELAGLDLPVHYESTKTNVPCDLYVDDHGPTVLAMERLGCRAALFDQPWNREHDTMLRVSGWDAIEALACT